MKAGKEGNWKNYVIAILIAIVIIETILLINNKDIRFSSNDDSAEKNKFDAETAEIIREINIAYIEAILNGCIEDLEDAYHDGDIEEITALEEQCNDIRELINLLLHPPD